MENNLNSSPVEPSLNTTPVSHNSYSSSISGCKKTSMSFPGALRPGISNVHIKYDVFMHNHGGKLYAVKTTGHILYDKLMSPNGLKQRHFQELQRILSFISCSRYFSDMASQET